MLPGRCLTLAVIAAFAPAPAFAQRAWDAILSIAPYPSPYYSDWDNDPNIASLTVFNTTTSAQQVRIHFNVTNHANRIVVSGNSDPQTIGAGATVIFDNPYDVAGSTHRDEEEEDIAARTGRLREGDYVACAVVADLTGFSLAESCAPFTIVYPDPPLLVGPDNGEVISQPDPLFQWTPVQVPIDFQLSYVLRVVEILQGQTPQEALRSNIPHFQMLDGQFPSLRYPIDARPFEEGKRYAWTVQVLDQNGYAAAGNDGRSEIWTFRYGEAPRATSEEPTLNLLVLNSDAGDTDDGERGDDAELEAYGDDFADLCLNWGAQPPLGMRIDIAGKRAFPRRMVLNNAVLIRKNITHGTHTRPQWVIYGDDPGRQKKVMLAGDCYGANFEVTRRRWIATRPLADAEELASWIPTEGDELTHSIGRLKFATRVFSWFEEEIGKDEALPQIRAFLEENEIEVKPGVNFFGVMNADRSVLWNLLSHLGFDADDEVELNGFIGLNSEVGAKFSLGTEQGLAAGLEAEAELLVVSSTAVKEFQNSIIKSVELGIELGFGVTLEGETGQKETTGSAGVEAALKLILTLTDRSDDEWSGELGIGFEFERNEEGKNEAKLQLPSITLKTEKAWKPWRDVELEFGRPELELEFSKAVAGEDKGKGVAFEGTVKGAVVLFDEEIGTGEFSFERGGNATTGERAVDKAQENLKARQETLSKAIDKDDKDAIAKALEALAQAEAQLETAQKTRAYEESQQELAKNAGTTYQPPVSKGEWDFKFTIGIGNMSLLNLIDLVHKARLAMP